MTTYTYEAYDKKRITSHGEFEANTRDEVVDFLAKKNLIPVSIMTLSDHRKKGGLLAFSIFDHLKTVDIVFMVRNFETMIRAGLSIIETLEILIADSKGRLKEILLHTQASIRGGMSLSRSFELYGREFPEIFIGMIRAGEISGQLDKRFAELGQYLKREYDLKQKIRSALLYPIILLVASMAVVSLLLIFVLPRLAKAFAASKVELPLVTKVVIFMSDVVTYSFTLDIIVLAIGIWFFTRFRKTLIGKRFFLKVLSTIPVTDDLVKKVALVRFSRTFGNLIGSGMPAVESMELTASTIGNENYRIALLDAVVDVQNGIAFSKALAKNHDLFPNIVIGLIVVGEKSGSLEQILTELADFYEDEVENKLKDLSLLIEPLLLLMMGLVVGSVAVSILLPIYQLVGKFT